MNKTITTSQWSRLVLKQNIDEKLWKLTVVHDSSEINLYKLTVSNEFSKFNLDIAKTIDCSFDDTSDVNGLCNRLQSRLVKKWYLIDNIMYTCL